MLMLGVVERWKHGGPAATVDGEEAMILMVGTLPFSLLSVTGGNKAGKGIPLQVLRVPT